MQWLVCLIISLLCVISALILHGIWHVRMSRHLIPKRDLNDGDLRPGDMLFFRTKERDVPSKAIGVFIAKGAIGSPYTHVGVVCKSPFDGSLCTLEMHVPRGCAVLRPLARRLREFKNRLAVRRLVDRTLEPNERTVNAMLRHELVPFGDMTLAHSLDVFQRHVLLTCPDCAHGTTCADLVVRYLIAAGFWSANNTQRTSCTSVSDLFWSNEAGPRREPPFRPKLKISM